VLSRRYRDTPARELSAEEPYPRDADVAPEDPGG